MDWERTKLSLELTDFFVDTCLLLLDLFLKPLETGCIGRCTIRLEYLYIPV